MTLSLYFLSLTKPVLVFPLPIPGIKGLLFSSIAEGSAEK